MDVKDKAPRNFNTFTEIATMLRIGKEELSIENNNRIVTDAVKILESSVYDFDFIKYYKNLLESELMLYCSYCKEHIKANNAEYAAHMSKHDKSRVISPIEELS
jgi:hypothetical protein